jgi:hypothetical protein
MVDFAATYSICLKPQCGHSTLALAGDDLITSSVGEGQKLTASREGRLGRFFVANNFWPAAGCRFDTHPAGNFRFPDKGGAFFNDEAGSLQISLKRAFRLQFATLAHGNVPLHLAVNRDRLCFDFGADVCIFADRQRPIGINFAFDFTIDQKFLLELDRAFDFDVAGKDVFAGMFSHKLFVIAC